MASYDYRGAIHCHSTYSDGTGTVEEVMKAANDVGLDFVLLTDHDSLKAADEGQEKWHGSSLLICGTEITPANNHLIAFGDERLQGLESLREKSPQEIIDAVNGQGWFGFLAHPDSPGNKRFQIPSAKWLEWGVQNYAGMGLWDLMSDWQAQLDRDDVSMEMYTDFASWLTGPRQDTIARWDELCRSRKVVGIGEVDNHRYAKEFNGQTIQIFPYDVAFRTVINHVLLDRPLEKDYAKARRQVLQALRQGSLYISFDFWDDPTEFNFEVDNGDTVGGMGQEIALGEEKTELVVMLPDEAIVNVFHNGESIHEDEADEVLLEITEPGVYRIEAMRNDLTWILSNPIWVKK